LLRSALTNWFEPRPVFKGIKTFDPFGFDPCGSLNPALFSKGLRRENLIMLIIDYLV